MDCVDGVDGWVMRDPDANLGSDHGPVEFHDLGSSRRRFALHSFKRANREGPSTMLRDKFLQSAKSEKSLKFTKETADWMTGVFRDRV